MTKIVATRRKNPANAYLATSDDELNMAFGRTKEDALKNLEWGMAQRI